MNASLTPRFGENAPQSRTHPASLITLAVVMAAVAVYFVAALVSPIVYSDGHDAAQSFASSRGNVPVPETTGSGIAR